MGIFNSTNKISGFYQAFSGTKAAINIARASGGGSVEAGAGFMVNRYSVSFGRNVSIQRFLNVKDNVAMVGTGTGTCRLEGLLGKLADFKRLLVGTGSSEDICNQLILTIEDSSAFTKCSGDAAEKSSDKRLIKCSGGIITSITLGGQIDQAGVLMQTGSLDLTFTDLELG